MRGRHLRLSGLLEAAGVGLNSHSGQGTKDRLPLEDLEALSSLANGASVSWALGTAERKMACFPLCTQHP